MICQNLLDLAVSCCFIEQPISLPINTYLLLDDMVSAMNFPS